MYPKMVALKAQVNMEGTETEKRLAAVLFEDHVQVLSTFELNQIASLSYGDESCDQIFEMIRNCLVQPLDFSVLTLQKSLAITKHLLIYGSSKCVNSAWGLGRFVEVLQDFNTVLWTHEEKGVGSWWMQFKGGSVDKGHPVREAASTLHTLLQDENKVQRLRHDKADPNSLVPVGDDRVGFVTDDVRLYLLRKRMEDHVKIRTKSNLAKSQGGFGSGFNAKDGKKVVGAAHSLDEMIARAERAEKKYSDTGPIHFKPKSKTQPKPRRPQQPPQHDLLDFGSTEATTTNPIPEVDLLGFGPATPAPAPVAATTTVDIFAPTPATTQDLLAPTLATNLLAPISSNAGENTSPATQSDLLGLVAAPPAADPMNAPSVMAAPVLNVTATPSDSQSRGGGFTGVSVMSSSKPAMSSSEDRFAALDALASQTNSNTNSTLEGLEAEKRILGVAGGPEPTGKVSDGGLESLGATATQQPVSDGLSPLGMVGGLPPAAPDNNQNGVGAIGDHHAVPPLHGDVSLAEGGGIMGGSSTFGVVGALDTGDSSRLPVGQTEPIKNPPPAEMPPPSSLPAVPPPEPPPPLPNTSSLPTQSERYGMDYDDGDDGFLMGGAMGSGLSDPVVAAPAAPPPPPPTA